MRARATSHSHSSRRQTRRQHRGAGCVQSRNHLHADTAGSACIRHTPTQGTPYPRLHLNQVHEETRSTRSAEGPHFHLRWDPSQNETCLYTLFPNYCVFFRPLFCVVASLRTSAGAFEQHRLRWPSIRVHPAGSFQSTQTNHRFSPSCQV